MERDAEMVKRLGERPDALACGAVRDCTGINPATLSHHMKELEIAGLVGVVREGKFASYVLRRDVLEAFFQRLREDYALRTKFFFGWSFALMGAVTLSKKECENSASRTFSSDRGCRTPHVHS